MRTIEKDAMFEIMKDWWLRRKLIKNIASKYPLLVEAYKLENLEIFQLLFDTEYEEFENDLIQKSHFLRSDYDSVFEMFVKYHQTIEQISFSLNQIINDYQIYLRLCEIVYQVAALSLKCEYWIERLKKDHLTLEDAKSLLMTKVTSTQVIQYTFQVNINLLQTYFQLIMVELAQGDNNEIDPEMFPQQLG